MSEASQLPPLPRHTRRQPPEWIGLIEHAEKYIGTDWPVMRPFEQPALDGVAEAVEAMDNETLEQNRYYGLGLVVCGIVRSLATEEARAVIISHSAEQISASSYSDYRYHRADFTAPYAGIRLSDLNGIQHAPVGTLSNIWKRRLDPVVRLVADSLETTAMVQLHGNDRDTDRALHYLRRYNGTDSNSIDGAGTDLMSGAMISYKQALLRFAMKHSGLNGLSDPLVADIIGPSDLKALDVTTAALNGARLRIDEFSQYYGGLIDVAGTKAAFKRNEMPAVPRRLNEGCGIDGKPLLHEARLACPALHVRGAIPKVMTLVPDIILKAQELSAAHIPERESINA